MREISPIEKQATALTRWVGSPASIVTHTIVFALSFALAFFGLITFDRMLLVLTTIVSLEAIYLAIFIQMTVNRQSEAIAEVEQDLDEIQEDMGEIQEDLDEIGEDVEELQEDVEELGEDVEEISEDVEDLGEDKAEEKRKREQKETLQNIHDMMQKLAADIEELRK